jgi:hypothetical protein
VGGTGPVRPGSTTASIRYRRGLGGTAVWLLGGLGETAVPGPFPGMTFYINPITDILTLAAGFTFILQVFPVDAGATFGHASSAGLELTFGL